MDINLGNIGVSAIQINNARMLVVDPIKGFSHKEDEVTVVATRDLSSQERTSLISSLQALPTTDTEKENRKDRKKSVLQKLGLNKNDIQSLQELILDGNDD